MVATWPLLIIGAVGLILTLVLLTGSRVFAGTRPVTRAFWCPFRARNAIVGFQQSLWEGSLVDVDECTVFSPPTAVTCDKQCRHLPAFPPAR